MLGSSRELRVSMEARSMTARFSSQVRRFAALVREKRAVIDRAYS